MIKSIGVEIEGGFGELPKPFFNNSNEYNQQIFRTDTSVKGLTQLTCRSCGSHRRNCNCGSNMSFDEMDLEEGIVLYVGEIASFPYQKINPLLKWMNDNYAVKTNKHCGLHAHIMPENHLEYQKLMSFKFYKDLIKALRLFGQTRGLKKDSEFYRRLNGQEDYCKRGHLPIKQGSDSQQDRYRILNFCHSKHGTVEIRVLPAFQNKMIAIDSIRFVYDFINSWLLINTRFMKPITAKTKLPEVKFT